MSLSQVDLIAAIWNHLDRQGIKQLNTRQMNATIEAADIIVAAIGEAHVPASPGMGLRAWLRCDETGESSKAMAAKLAPLAGLYAPVPRDSTAHPLDPGDFGRCMGLLAAAPELRPHVARMAEVSPAWAALAGVWDELESLWVAESTSGRCPRLYDRMKDLRDEAARARGGRA